MLDVCVPKKMSKTSDSSSTAPSANPPVTPNGPPEKKTALQKLEHFIKKLFSCLDDTKKKMDKVTEEVNKVTEKVNEVTDEVNKVAEAVNNVQDACQKLVTLPGQ